MAADNTILPESSGSTKRKSLLLTMTLHEVSEMEVCGPRKVRQSSKFHHVYQEFPGQMQDYQPKERIVILN